MQTGCSSTVGPVGGYEWHIFKDLQQRCNLFICQPTSPWGRKWLDSHAIGKRSHGCYWRVEGFMSRWNQQRLSSSTNESLGPCHLFRFMGVLYPQPPPKKNTNIGKPWVLRVSISWNMAASEGWSNSGRPPKGLSHARILWLLQRAMMPCYHVLWVLESMTWGTCLPTNYLFHFSTDPQKYSPARPGNTCPSSSWQHGTWYAALELQFLNRVVWSHSG